MKEIETIELPVSQEQEALDFLMEPKLATFITDDLAALGYAGENRNKLFVYLIATSRKMKNPLACAVRGESSAGKSYLVETIMRFIPDEGKEILTRVTEKAFFYEADLSHKIIYIAEGDGCEEASYAVRALLSEKVLRMRRTVGMRVQELVVYGPVAYIETTAGEAIEAQKANRVFEIWVDESEEQTLKIHEVQRENYTLKGLERNQQIHGLIEKHHNAQRLLKPLSVAIPYAMEINFPSRTVRSRRDHQRFLDLVSASAFLHQFQRPHSWLNDEEYVEAALEDYEVAHWLMEPILLQALDDYRVKSRELLDGIYNMIRKRAAEEGKPLWNIIFTRAELAEFMGLTKRQVRTHVKELEELEAIEIVRGGRGREYKYKLLCDPAADRIGSSKLLKPEELRRKLDSHLQFESTLGMEKIRMEEV